VGEVAKQGVPLADLERRLFRLAAEHPARIVTTRGGDVFFRFEDVRVPPFKSLRDRAALVAPLGAFAASESFVLLFPLPFLAVRCLAVVLALVTSCLRSARPKSQRRNFVERWASGRDPELAEELASEDAKRGAPWRAFLEGLWPITGRQNALVRGPLRRQLIANAVICQGGRVLATDLLPYLDPGRCQTADEFVESADGLVQPFVADLDGRPAWGTSPIEYEFPDKLRLEAAAAGQLVKEGNPLRWFAGCVRRAFGALRERIKGKPPSFLEEYEESYHSDLMAGLMSVQLFGCLFGALLVPLRIRFLGAQRIGLLPAGLAARAWPFAALVALALLLGSRWQRHQLEKANSAIRHRNSVRLEVAKRNWRRRGDAAAIPVDLESETLYDTSETSAQAELRRFGSERGESAAPRRAWGGKGRSGSGPRGRSAAGRGS